MKKFLNNFFRIFGVVSFVYLIIIAILFVVEIILDNKGYYEPPYLDDEDFDLDYF